MAPVLTSWPPTGSGPRPSEEAEQLSDVHPATPGGAGMGSLGGGCPWGMGKTFWGRGSVGEALQGGVWEGSGTGGPRAGEVLSSEGGD